MGIEFETKRQSVFGAVILPPLISSRPVPAVPATVLIVKSKGPNESIERRN